MSFSSSWLKWTGSSCPFSVLPLKYDMNFQSLQLRMWIIALVMKTHGVFVAKDPVALVRRFQKNVAYWELQEMAKGSWFQPDMIDHDCRWNTLYIEEWFYLLGLTRNCRLSTIRIYNQTVRLAMDWLHVPQMHWVTDCPGMVSLTSRFSGASRKNVPAKAREKKKTSKINYKMR